MNGSLEAAESFWLDASRQLEARRATLQELIDAGATDVEIDEARRLLGAALNYQQAAERFVENAAREAAERKERP